MLLIESLKRGIIFFYLKCDVFVVAGGSEWLLLWYSAVLIILRSVPIFDISRCSNKLPIQYGLEWNLKLKKVSYFNLSYRYVLRIDQSQTPTCINEYASRKSQNRLLGESRRRATRVGYRCSHSANGQCITKERGYNITEEQTEETYTQSNYRDN